ncbi:hypothetical protein Clacol_001678 [Clathrus columnatus]|uniref:Protein DOM34 homolog n=1 Tax=Clathrus columnatus TaxID=1419009 RepID=A0AAV5A4F7_9AGAM|nr:hypothetical protein Clacol_001678 [Clathrus columnatus]
MKLVSKHIEKGETGYVTLRPEDDEDMWHLYNLIQEGDQVRAPAIRRVVTVSSTGSTDSQRIRMSLTLEVTRITFSPSASTSSTGPSGNPGSEATSMLQILGRVASENPHVKMGAYHTLDIEINRDIRIIKQEWDSITLERIDEACVEGRGAEIGAIVCGEGTAAFCLLSEHMTTIRQRIEVPIPRKRTGSITLHEKGLQRFYGALYNAFLRHIPYTSLRVVVIASPGFTRDAVYDYIFEQAVKTNNKALLHARQKFIRVHISSPHVHSLVEMLKSPQTQIIMEFFKTLGSEEERAWYGPDHVELAEQRGAIGSLLISDELFRASDPIQRKRFINLVEGVRQKGGEVFIFSSMHETGQQLNQLTGIAALLTFPLNIEVVEAEEREAQEKVKQEQLNIENDQQ